YDAERRDARSQAERGNEALYPLYLILSLSRSRRHSHFLARFARARISASRRRAVSADCEPCFCADSRARAAVLSAPANWPTSEYVSARVRRMSEFSKRLSRAARWAYSSASEVSPDCLRTWARPWQAPAWLGSASSALPKRWPASSQ